MLNIDDESNWAGIVNFSIDGVDVSKLTSYLLTNHRIFTVAIVFEEFLGIRVTPNVYTLVSEMDLFADIIEKVANGEVMKVLK